MTDVSELLSRLAGVHTRVFQLHCTRTDDDNPPQPQDAVVTPSIQIRGSNDFQEIRLEIHVHRSDVEVTVEVGFQFAWTEPLTYEKPEQLAMEFAQVFGLKYAVDYIRPLLDDLTRLVDLPLIGLKHDVTDRWQLDSDEDGEEPSETDSDGGKHRSTVGVARAADAIAPTFP
ncbi:hypothetical protein O1W68_07895 [Rhodococcus sp. H36-A4]|uniref:hypothetical protein n=1 Tax=Rhodococcus sp. H36-A4 TaxID=3004353 RepID=UPI0022AF9BCA|nr:hypothetical protein [Rhodococcus sp. H36-A4]MCZ4077857.1 hypothetical protein [Rhodococcus sp. H36-A4]